HLPLKVEERQQLLEGVPKDRLDLLSQILTREVNILELERKIQNRVRKQMEKSQREYFLKEQMKAIQQELGESDERQSEVTEYKKKIEAANLPDHVKEKALEELNRLEKMPAMVAEAVVVRTYLDWILAVPWTTRTEDRLDIAEARAILDEDHYGLEKPKERVIEYLAVRKLAPTSKGPILCFIGAPGVGKTSIGKSIARALGRKFVRISLGGVRDEAEIRGHRRTYIGALPGQIVQGLRRAGSKNPVFMLDEIDKLGMDFRGDPASALLEVLDPEQNSTFRDHYVDVPFDLSKALFITTANILDPVPPALRDRMEVLELPGYTEEEKVAIARRHLIPKQTAEHGLVAGEQIEFTEDALRLLIRNYTREAGLRKLEREIATLCRKVARRRAEGQDEQVIVSPAVVGEYLGAPTYLHEELEERTRVPGVAVGLAWTAAGGDILFVEAIRMKGGKTLTLTGQLGDVMKESAQAALSWVRSHAVDLAIPSNFWESSDIHFHVPAGAIPKDGPSAGVTLVTALVSLLRGRSVRPNLAMTGEITLSGRVLPVGGIKEKVLAAKRAGVKSVFLPKRNEKNLLEDVPQTVRDSMTFHLVDTIAEVIGLAFAELPGRAEPVVTREVVEVLADPASAGRN
ncbi:MAG: endopeptidase La, partial [Candidatus Rokubacteria bacterium]|nr:endopeptidase La [Candidatus Rokubacteria bacterium]